MPRRAQRAVAAAAYVLCAPLAAAQDSPQNAVRPSAKGAEPETFAQAGGLPQVIVTPPVAKQKSNTGPKRKRKPTPATAAVPDSVDAGFVKMSPVTGSELAIGKVPGTVSTVTAADMARWGAVTIEEALQVSVPGVIISDLQGNVFQTDIQYRGFSASPVDGVPQGLAVYQNGVRINEAFGDTLNWDFLPLVAIDSITVMTNNPVFGLNAIGGTVSLAMKDGFGFQGVETDTRFGSFGLRMGSLQAGSASGPVAAYLALEGIHDDGYRDQGSAEIR